jgi:polyribonucleotide nucleotidyltransferase
MTLNNKNESRVIVSTDFHGKEISLETGWIAQQANGSIMVRQGETMVLITVCRANAREGQDFFPLTVEYQEKFYAAGRIPGGFFKREGRPTEGEVLICRLIDRPIRPLFPDGYFDEVQLICTVLSADGINNPDMLAITGASAALHISDIPFLGPLAAVRVGRVKQSFVINPNKEQLAQSDIDFVIAGTKDAITMVEGGANFVPEKEVLDALFFGHAEIRKLLDLQDELKNKVGKPKEEFTPKELDKEIVERVNALSKSKFSEAYKISGKSERRQALSDITNEVQTALAEDFAEREGEVSKAIDSLTKSIVRERVLNEHLRIDGRGLQDVRDITCEVGIIPRAHGSSVFTRGETQAIVTATLGNTMDAQRIDSMIEYSEKHFMLHYNFPPYSTGEVKMLRTSSRREVGHGALAERALRYVIPSVKDFPYVIRVVSEVTASNGSSSMASVCGGTLALLDAGVKITHPVAGVAMGLIKEGEKVAVLTDILGDEDHLGDMDFKVAGTNEGVTALQMDIKCSGLNRDIMGAALEQARTARLGILKKMNSTLKEARSELSKYAPSIVTIKISPDRIKDVIGPGGKTIRSITETTGVKIDISDDGTVNVFSADSESSKRALDIINSLTEEAEIGRVYNGVVKRIMDFGAFVEILPGTEGLVHISQLSHDRVNQVSDIVKEGEEVKVRVMDIDRQGKIRLTCKDVDSL